MNYSDMTTAVADAHNTLQYADMVANKIAHLLVGRLRKVGSAYVLGKLKKELRDYNAHTGEWK